MSISSRVALYQQIEKLRKRPLIVYVTSTRAEAGGQMAADAIPEICDQIALLPPKCNKVDLLVVSNGGDSMVAWQTILMLRERVSEISVLVPQRAYSAATLLALGADEIVMHPFANLGPIDPQISAIRKDKDGRSERIRFSSEDMEGFLDFARDKVGLSDQAHMLEAFKLACADTGSLTIGFSMRGSKLSQQLGVKLIQTRKAADKKDDRKAQQIVERLNKQYFTHGYALGRKEAEQIGLPVIMPETKIESAMWRAWQEIEKDLKVREPFNPLAMVAALKEAAPLFMPPPSVELPSNMPPDLAKNIWQQVVSQIREFQLPPLEYKRVCALVESVRSQRMCIASGKLAAVRTPDGGVSVSNAELSCRWTKSIDESN